MRFSITIVLSAILFVQSAEAMEVDLAPVHDILPDGEVAEGENDIRRAWLSAPTDHYAHGVLGDKIEAGAITVDTHTGERLTLTLPQNAVFEDRYPRLHDIDGDGRDEMVVVKSTNTQGAALAIIGIRNNKLQILAETEPIGQPYRWLNPVGVGDFDGDGEKELAYIEKPHIEGTLRVVKWQGTKLAKVYEACCFSNHFIGSRELTLSAAVDFDGDGILELVIPNTTRMELRIISFKDGQFKEIERARLDAPIIRMKTDYAFMGALVAIQANGFPAGLRMK